MLTPEEWVRQHVLYYLINDKGFPLALLAVEHQIDYNGMRKRADIVAYSRSSTPVFIVECKAPEVPIDQSTLQQIAKYNFDLNVDFLLLTNGIEHFMCQINREEGRLLRLDEIPAYDKMLQSC